MGRSPFATKGLFPQAGSSRRRSTRIEFATPILLTGRDAAGQTFREETATSIVNLHGAKLRTSHHIMVGMIVSLENPRTGQRGKAVCVQVLDTPPGQTVHDIAVQLVQPGNIWGVENPPPDWETVEAELGGRGLAPAMANDETPAYGMEVVSKRSVTASPALRAGTDVQLAELEKRAARLIDSVLDILRIQADAAVRNALQDLEKGAEGVMATAASRVHERAEQAGAELEATLETFRTEAMGEVVSEALQGFQQQLETLATEFNNRITHRAEEVLGRFEVAVKNFQQRQETLAAEADARIAQRTEQAFEEFEAALQTFRADVGDELASRRDEVVQATEEALRKRVAVVLSKIQITSPAPFEIPDQGPTLKK